jgi:LacI family transcriptional regulator
MRDDNLVLAGAGATRARPTMHDVAALAGVSLKTVSRVVNREPGVSAELATRVEHAAAKLDYRPNLTASSLRRADRKTATIGLLLEDVANPFSSAVHRAIEDAARRRGVAVFAASLDEDPDRERQIATAFVSRRVDGLIMVPAGSDHSYLLRERQAGLAIVFIDRPAAFLEADTVLTANRAGAADGVRHLLRHGHRRVAYLGDLRSISTASERFEGYLDAIREAGLPLDDRIIRHDLRSVEAADRAAEELLGLPLHSRPTALFTSQNLVTIGAVRALRRLGRQHAIALTGFDDVLMADMLDPGLTVVAQDPGAMGRAASELLFRRLDGDPSTTQLRIIPTRLTERGSGEIRAAGES